MEKKTNQFLQIIEQHKGIIYKIANSYCPDIEARKDLIQEIAIQIWQSLETYNAQFKVSTWIYRIALNTAISFYRKNTTYTKRVSPIDPLFERNLLDESRSVKKCTILIRRRTHNCIFMPFLHSVCIIQKITSKRFKN